MKHLIAHPIAAVFRSPITPDDEPPDYFRVITNPIDLSTILERLERDQYATVQDWLAEVDTVWSNCEKYYDSLPQTSQANRADRRLYGIVVSENRRLFAKETRKFDGLVLANWCRNLYARRTEVTKLMTQPPGKIKQFTASLGAARVTRQNPGGMSDREMVGFVNAAGMIQSDADHRELIALLTKLEPEAELDNGSPTLSIDVTKLKPTTIQEVRAFMKGVLEKQGMKYPE
jgi:hypothetical protein